MSETIRHGEHDAEIIPFRQRTDFLDEMSDAEVLDHFLSELRHPGVSGRLASYILEYAGSKPREGLTHVQQAWRDRMSAIRFSVGISNNDWDRLMDQDDEAYDAGFAAIATALQDTRKDNELAEERQALLVLLDYRIAALNRGLEDPSAWKDLARRLVEKK